MLLTCVVALLLCGFSETFADEEDYSGYKVFVISPKTVSQRKAFRESFVPAFVNHTFGPGETFWVAHGKHEDNIRKFLKSFGISDMIVDVEDLQPIMSEARKFMASDDQEMDWKQYHSYESIQRFMRKNSIKGEMFSIGKTSEDQDVAGIRFNPGKSKLKVWIDAGIHAREWMAPAVATYVINQLATKYEEDQEIIDLVDWWIVPMLNPDGYTYSRKRDNLWRKNRKKYGSKICVGVDLNRNFDSHWRETGASNIPCSDTYAGPKVASEAETQGLQNTLLKLNSDGSVILYVSLHSFSQVWLSPWCWTTEFPDNYSDLMEIMEAAVNVTEAVGGVEYLYGTASNVMYRASGCSMDYVLQRTGIRHPFTIELSPRKFRSDPSGFWPDPEKIIPTGQDIWAALKAAVQVAVRKSI